MASMLQDLWPTDGPLVLNVPSESGGGSEELIVRGLPQAGSELEAADVSGEASARETAAEIVELLGSSSFRKDDPVEWLIEPGTIPSESEVNEAVELFEPSVATKERTADWALECVRHTFSARLDSSVVRLPYLVRPTRAELVRRALGWPAAMYSNRPLPKTAQPVAVYVDISASMSEHARDVLAFLQCVRDHLPSRLYLFDVGVREVDRDELLDRRYYSGGGTDFERVYEHAMDQQFEESVMVTDGLSLVSEGVLERFRARGLRMNAVIFVSKQMNDWTGLNMSWWDRWTVVGKDRMTQMARR